MEDILEEWGSLDTVSPVACLLTGVTGFYPCSCMFFMQLSSLELVVCKD